MKIPLATAQDSHSQGLLEHPHYTRPAEFRGWGVPEILLSGNHAEVARWRRQQSLLRTAQSRPDLLAKADLTEQERHFLQQVLAVRAEPTADPEHPFNLTTAGHKDTEDL